LRYRKVFILKKIIALPRFGLTISPVRTGLRWCFIALGLLPEQKECYPLQGLRYTTGQRPVESSASTTNSNTQEKGS